MNFDPTLAKLNNDRPALASSLLIIGVVLLAMVIGNILAAVVMILVGQLGIQDLENLNASLMASDTGWWALMLGQGVASLVTFIVAGVFYWRIIEKKELSELSFKRLPKPIVFGFIILIQICFLPLNGWLQEFNESMKLPESWVTLESFFRSMEDTMAKLTVYLTKFDSFPKMIVGLIVIALIAGIGEELIFRGLIQRKLYKGLKNPHLAIWGAAIIFSAIHMQFYGFLPRLMLGAMFGYFYYWTGNIWVPMAAHFFNNGLAVVVFYLSNKGYITQDVDEIDNFSMPMIFLSLLLTAFLMWFLKINRFLKDEYPEI